MSQLRVRTHLYIRWIFLRILALCFLSAFFSISNQVLGLFGAHGILPIKAFLDFVAERIPAFGWLQFPSIFWFSATDSFLQAICWTGVFVSFLALFGIFTGPSLTVLWFLYLSIVSVGQDFMGFQWDALLLETALLAIWFAPWQFREIHPFNRKLFQEQTEVSYLFLWLLRLLCFKLMMFSGLCKLASNDPTWRDLSSMTYHYLTQPLPTPLAWLMQKVPSAALKLSTLAMFFIEIILPFGLMTFARKARIFASFGFILLMVAIMFTGNYAFFNWLTIALSITLLDDELIFSVLPRSLKKDYKLKSRRVRHVIWNSTLSGFPALLIGFVSTSYLWLMVAQASAERFAPPEIFKIPIALSQPLSSFNSYGLFAVMTTSRHEIIVEGSNDGVLWLPYEFKYKPGDIHIAPPIVAPQQPRLDWQMWFAALAPADSSSWFNRFVYCLLNGSPDVLKLMRSNPFPISPPKMIRASLYDYHFSDFQSLISKGEWWQRNKIGEFYPATTIEDLKQQGSPVF